MPQPTSILCPVDFSPHSQRTVRHAIALARHEGARLCLLHVLEPLLVQAAAMTYQANHLEEEACRELNVLLTSLGAREPSIGVPLAARVKVGVPHAQIFEAATEVGADLLVLGTQGHTGASRVFFGSTFARVLRQTALPVLAIGSGSGTLVDEAHEGPRLRVSRIVAGVDFGDMTGHTVREAAQLAARFGAKLELLHAVDEAHGMDLWRRLVDERQRQQVARAEKELGLLADEVRGTTPNVIVRTAIGTPELVLADAGREQSGTLLVLGLRSQHGLLGPQPGSTAYRVLCLSEAPILVLPPPSKRKDRRR
jgi:nucleotide-binding universal stress UspA family protein